MEFENDRPEIKFDRKENVSILDFPTDDPRGPFTGFQSRFGGRSRMMQMSVL